MTRKPTIQALVSQLLVAATVLLLSLPQEALAQGKTGTTVTLDGTNCTVLYSQGAQSSSQAFFSYLRHNAIPIQIINANYYGLADNGTGFFGAMVNNMGITDGSIALYNNAGNYSELYIAIIAPQGYNIARYQMDVNSSHVRSTTAGSAAGAVIEEYTYTQNNSDGQRVLTGNVFTLSGSASQVFDVTKSGVNKLYFRVGFKDTKAYQISFNSLKLTFTVDEPFEISIPNESGGTDVHTGLVNLGEFKKNTKGVWTFTDTNVTDVQDFGFFGLDDQNQNITVGTTKVEGEDYVWTLKNGTFYLEAPKTYRVTGATLKFLSTDVLVEGTTNYNPVTSVSSGEKYLIGNGTSFLRISGSYSYYVTTTTSKEYATEWIVTSNGAGAYYIYSPLYKRYLYADGSGLELSTTTAAGNYGSVAAWTYDAQTGYLYMTYKGKKTTETYYLRYRYSALGVTNETSGTNGNSRISHPFTQIVYEGDHMVSSTYTATVYGTDANTPVDTYEISPENNVVTVPLSGLNNDAVKFSISGLSGDELGVFRVSIDVLMLDPFVQTIETAYVEDGKTVSAVSSSSENLMFNNGETIVVPIPGTSGSTDATKTYQLAFRNAFNENQSVNVAGTPSGNGLSNYYLVDSPYELTGAGSHIDADRAGTVELEFTNIKQVKAGSASYLQDNEFSKTAASYQAINLRNGQEKTVYIYAADKPTYVLLPEGRRTEHIAYSYYKAKVMPYVVEEVPDLEMADVSDIIVYNKTLKGANNKKTDIGRDSDVDTQHYFFGIKVKAKKEDPNNTSEVKGILTSEQIINAVRDLLIVNFKDHLYDVDDPFRTILYLDMSELTAVSDADGLWDDFRAKTADNCLYFMPKSFSQQTPNVVAGGKGGDGEAVGDIRIYDQQPFFTPYDFKTGTHMVTYQRTGTNGKEPTQHTTLMMPFDIPLSADGHLKTYSNQVDEKVQFYTMTELGAEDQEASVDTEAYTFTAANVTTGTAVANTPYHIVSQKAADNDFYTISLTGATFRQTPASGAASTDGGQLTGYGSYCGVAVDKTEDVLYFSKDYFWRSSTLKTSNTVKILPYRAYYKSAGDLGNAAKFAVVFSETGDLEPSLPTAIATRQAGDFSIDSTDGALTVTAHGDTHLRVYDLAGRKVVDQQLGAGTTRTYPLRRGLYVAGQRKVLVK